MANTYWIKYANFASHNGFSGVNLQLTMNVNCEILGGVPEHSKYTSYEGRKAGSGQITCLV